MKRPDHYSSFTHLARHHRHGEDYEILRLHRGSRLAVVAPHGGGIERGTSEIARALAGEELSLYCFESRRALDNGRLHVTSANFDEPGCLSLVAASQQVVTVHGCYYGRHDRGTWVGGLDPVLGESIIEALRGAGFAADRDSRNPGVNPRNICNRGRAGRGVQLELAKGLRRQMFVGLDPERRRQTTAVFQRFVAVLREVLLAAEGDADRRHRPSVERKTGVG